MPRRWSSRRPGARSRTGASFARYCWRFPRSPRRSAPRAWTPLLTRRRTWALPPSSSTGRWRGIVAAELNHEAGGRPDGSAIVFTGSLGTDLTMWKTQSDRLGERFRTLRYDIRGHGHSDVPNGPYSIADLGSDLVALLDRAGIERASLCGLSIGGMISMWVAARHPERVERVVLCCTSALLGPPEGWHQRAATVRAEGVEAIARSVLERWFT